MAKKKTRNTKVAVVSQETQVANELTAQYGIVVAKTGEMLREAVKFGTMLMKWTQFLGESRGSAAGSNAGGANEGLKGWLESHCPEINYNTAMGYKHLAEKTVKMLGGGDMAIAALEDRSELVSPLGEVVDVDAKVLEKRDAIFAEADSRRKLEQMYFDFAGGREKGKPGRPKKSGNAAAPAPLSRVESAKIEWANIISEVVKHRAGLYSAAKLLPREEAEKSLDELKALCDALKARLDEEG